jgi:anthranilate synthase/aminodeoxychorismate synthase-like glutamine amidotransferase
MIILIDNYDSFTYNLVQRIGELDPKLVTRVYRNDKVTPEQVEADKPTHLIISPGPCTPREAGVSNDMIRHFAGKIPILGVCLGHQCMGYVHGANIVRAKRLMHGKTDQIKHDGQGIFKGLPQPLTATRYHSLVIRPDTLSPDFIVSGWADAPDGTQEIMAIRHKSLPVLGVQFHPESFLTEHGHDMLRNFLAM